MKSNLGVFSSCSTQHILRDIPLCGHEILLSMVLVFLCIETAWEVLALGFRLDTGILRGKTIADKLIYNPNNDTQNYSFCKLKLVVETFEHST